MELDLLERNIILAIEQSSVFSIGQIRMVYERCKSFDKTIAILKLAVSRGIDLKRAEVLIS